MIFSKRAETSGEEIGSVVIQAGTPLYPKLEGSLLRNQRFFAFRPGKKHSWFSARSRLHARKRLWTILLVVLFLLAGLVPGFGIEKAKIAVFMFKPSVEIYDRIMAGIKATFFEVGYRENRSVIFDYYEARNDEIQSIRLVEKIKAGSYDLVLSLGTRSTQILQENEFVEAPVLFSGVFDPVNAGIVPSLDGSGTNFAGSSHRQEFSKQFTYFREIVPSVKRLGIIYRYGEVNSLVQVVEVQSAKNSLGLTEVYPSPAQDADDLERATLEIIDKVDAIYLPADILVSSSAALKIRDVAITRKIPVFSALVDPTKYGALVSTYTDLFVLGKQVGRMAIRIIYGVEPGTMPIEFQQVPNVVVNRETAEFIEITIPESMKDKITGVIGKYLVISTGD
jgi:putative ABC transport system substrate-binding protein